MQQTRNLILVHQPGRQSISDFMEIAERIQARAPDIEVFIAGNDRLMTRTRRQAATRPTLVFSPGSLDCFRPARGCIMAGRPMPKLEELEHLAAGGLPVPAFVQYQPGMRLPAEIFGTHVVLKSGHPFSSLGRNQCLIRRQSLEDHGLPALKQRGARAVTWPEPVIVQRFVDTGEYPRQFRVLTLFGRPLYALSWASSVPRSDLDASDDVLVTSRITAVGHDFVDLRYAYDEDVLDLASRAYEAVPFIPLQGCDIIRDIHNGSLYILEINPGGNTWHFSSGLPIVPESKLRRRDQFGAWDRAAEVLIDKVRTLAV